MNVDNMNTKKTQTACDTRERWREVWEMQFSIVLQMQSDNWIHMKEYRVMKLMK